MVCTIQSHVCFYYFGIKKKKGLGSQVQYLQKWGDYRRYFAFDDVLIREQRTGMISLPTGWNLICPPPTPVMLLLTNIITRKYKCTCIYRVE
jgi:hypothetical protein